VEAERLYRVRGTVDPLRPAGEPRGLVGEPPPLSPNGKAMDRLLTSRGLHTYRLPTAAEYVEQCPGCQGYLCNRDCKNDSYRACIAPALARHGAELLAECEVVKLEATRTEVTGVVCRRGGEEATLRAPIVILGAGAFSTPALLLRSASSEWPRGLANGSDLVGRCFMRHQVDLYVVFGEEAARGRQPQGAGVQRLLTAPGGQARHGAVLRAAPAQPVLAYMLATEMRQNPSFLTEALVPFTPLVTSLGGRLPREQHHPRADHGGPALPGEPRHPGKGGGYELSYHGARQREAAASSSSAS
jgi:choline dehydrogenase-like flavoprotein